MAGVVTLILVAAVPVSAQRPATAATSLVFDRVTVVDVERGKLVAAQPVVITGNRIQSVGGVSTVQLPKLRGEVARWNRADVPPSVRPRERLEDRWRTT